MESFRPRSRPERLAVIVLLAAAWCLTPPGDQPVAEARSIPSLAQAASSQADLLLLDYLDLAVAHRPQQRDEAVRSVLALPYGLATQLIAKIPDLVTTLSRSAAESPIKIGGTVQLPGVVQARLELSDQERKTGDYLRLLVRVLTLHADAGLALQADGQWLLSAFQFALGAQAAENLVSPPKGSRLRTAIDRGRRPDLVARIQAHRAVARSAILAFGGRLTPSLRGDALRLLEAGVKLLGDDPEFDLALGAIHESFAQPEVQREIRREVEARERSLASSASDTDSEPRGLRRDRDKPGYWTAGNRASQLSDAARLFRQALGAPAWRDEASLRLGHVLTEQGKPAEAIPHLEVAAASADVFVRYLGLLMLGRVQADAGRREDAERNYRAAAALCPDAQAPLLGLSLLDDDTGRVSSALGGLNLALTGAADRSPDRDPWWVYYHGADRQAARHFDVLYAAARAAMPAPR